MSFRETDSECRENQGYVSLRIPKVILPIFFYLCKVLDKTNLVLKDSENDFSK